MDGGNTTIIQITQMAEPPALILQFPLICTTGELLYATRARTATRRRRAMARGDGEANRRVGARGSTRRRLLVPNVYMELVETESDSAKYF